MVRESYRGSAVNADVMTTMGSQNFKFEYDRNFMRWKSIKIWPFSLNFYFYARSVLF